ncbi:hypothetical protein BDP55DRAFT_632935 [Colletotrichum godetiae]|uniref:C2H2-type domain-containing protein n=1 Tax=Colletotrichum godetiae TaxID=1209918 RepID=A0AAJ0AIF1_9PEZI|nr:uncharacterized protein BDP55DRAFT_632935 [Colletotrichum godetiae]KAK1674487.1 hypothetical protein BDP55DRAFT_632935 [Colletotrichum godetiae]
MTPRKALACCGRTFAQKGNHERHIRTVHSDRRRMPCGRLLKPRSDNVKRHEMRCETCRCSRRGHSASENNSVIKSKPIHIEDQTPTVLYDPRSMEPISVEGFDQRHLEIAPTADSSQATGGLSLATIDSAIPAEIEIQIGSIDSISEFQVPSILFDTALSNTMEGHISHGIGNFEDICTYHYPYTPDELVHFEEENA